MCARAPLPPSGFPPLAHRLPELSPCRWPALLRPNRPNSRLARILPERCNPRQFRSSLADTDGSLDRIEPGGGESVDGVVNANPNGSDGEPVPTSFDFLQLKRELEEEMGSGSSEKEEPIPMGESKKEEVEDGVVVERLRVRGGRQMVRRSSLLAKQVISIRSAQSLGFISQLWVDTSLWVVALVEMRPNLLSGEIEKFLLDDISQVGDFVLVPDESVIENEFKMVGLDSLVGFNVVTSGRRNVGKVRGYTFNINSGAVESLELDSFGFSVIPASLVSTYCLFVEDVLDVISDTIVVHEGAVSRFKRLTKGLWDAHNIRGPGRQIYGYDSGRRGDFYVRRQRGGVESTGHKSWRKMREIEEDWDLPMDY